MIQETESFISFGIAESGLIFNDENHSRFPLKYFNVIDGKGIDIDKKKSYFIFVYEGEAKLSIQNGLKALMVKDTYLAHDGSFALDGIFKAIAIEIDIEKGDYIKNKYRAATTIGGVVEKIGRLKYIDGCTDSILIHPIKKGDPCLNHLHFPQNIIQTPHTHPSHRLGIVIRGEGECETPFGNLPLKQGIIFVIKEYNGTEMKKGLDGEMYEAGTHKFNTTDSSMDVIAFHPDSDFGAEDENHPMINKTIVKGVSANKIENIRTL
jgi:hypothetical protein